MEAIFVFVGPWVLESSHGTLSRGPICGDDGDDAVSISEGLVTEMIKLGAVAPGPENSSTPLDLWPVIIQMSV